MKLHRHTSALLLIPVVVLVAIAGQNRPSLLTTSVTIGIFCLLAVPLGFIYGQGGAISVAQGAFAAAGGYTSAILTTQMGWSPLASLVPAIVVPALLAFVMARPILRLPELSLALATLAFGMVFEVVIQRGGNLTRGFVGITGISPIPLLTTRLRSHVFVWIVVFILIVLYTNFIRSTRGRALNAIRVDRILAEGVGVPVATQLSAYFSMAAGIAGFAGWFYVHQIGYIAPESLGITLSANLLFMVVIGGRRTPLGPVLGAIVFTMSRDWLPGLESQNMFFGGMVILVLMLMPDGLLSVKATALRRRLGGAGIDDAGTTKGKQPSPGKNSSMAERSAK